MLPIINNKSLLDCTEDDLQIIIGDPAYRESRYIEYKEMYEPALYDNTKKQKRDDAKTEFRNDVCTFANAEGGYLILGVKEKKGIAQEITGIQIDDVDNFLLELKNCLQVIMPRMPNYQCNSIKLQSGKTVFVLFIQHDFFAPYIQLENEKNYRIYKRINNSKAV